VKTASKTASTVAAVMTFYTAMKAKILSTATRVMTLFTEGKIATFSMGVQGMTGCLATGETIL